MNLGMLLDMAADGFGDRVVVGRRDGGLTAEPGDDELVLGVGEAELSVGGGGGARGHVS